VFHADGVLAPLQARAKPGSQAWTSKVLMVPSISHARSSRAGSPVEKKRRRGDLIDRGKSAQKATLRGKLIISRLQVRVLPAPPRIPTFPEISRSLKTSAQLAGFFAHVYFLQRCPRVFGAVSGRLSLTAKFRFPETEILVRETWFEYGLWARRPSTLGRCSNENR
jgi:hypothetical protein